jgi:hypothetical protein
MDATGNFYVVANETGYISDKYSPYWQPNGLLCSSGPSRRCQYRWRSLPCYGHCASPDQAYKPNSATSKANGLCSYGCAQP